MRGLNTDMAIAHFNLTNKKKIDAGKIEKMTRVRLAVKMWPNVSRETASQYLSAVTLRPEEKITADQVRIMCKETGVDANFVLGTKPMKGIVL